MSIPFSYIDACDPKTSRDLSGITTRSLNFIPPDIVYDIRHTTNLMLLKKQPFSVVIFSK